jgi:hypothetical protein
MSPIANVAISRAGIPLALSILKPRARKALARSD